MKATAGNKRLQMAGKASWQFCLYVENGNQMSLRAMANLQRLCDEQLPERCHIEVIDVLSEPRRARTENIVALPTLIRTAPKPVLRVIGDLSDTQRVVRDLDMKLSA